MMRLEIKSLLAVYPEGPGPIHPDQSSCWCRPGSRGSSGGADHAWRERNYENDFGIISDMIITNYFGARPDLSKQVVMEMGLS